MKNIIHVVISLIIISSCSTYVRKPINSYSSTVKENTIQSMQGNYQNCLKGGLSLWNLISKKGKKMYVPCKSDNETIELSIVTSNIIKLRVKKNEMVKDSIFISGKFNNNSFIFDTKRSIENIFPLFWTYNKTKYSLKIDSTGNLKLISTGNSIIFLFVAPIMAADGDVDFVFNRK